MQKTGSALNFPSANKHMFFNNTNALQADETVWRRYLFDVNLIFLDSNLRLWQYGRRFLSSTHLRLFFQATGKFHGKKYEKCLECRIMFGEKCELISFHCIPCEKRVHLQVCIFLFKNKPEIKAKKL